MRGILAIGLACLLTIASPAFAADLNMPSMPVKAPPLVAPPPEPVFDYTGLLLGAAIIGGIAACVAWCAPGHEQEFVSQPVSPGSPNLPNS